ncbi:hypothetical protein NDU88_002610 [Pleurodeles waltl]|uniref:Uncharacterized protein n=1 Tax=Pleurodeles waltl TaxID=8319 RepID=A0AAV7UXU8_PLEWA|nr:hypothetical protein NDU88_002610 [Pleurodeles waltl]
MIYKSCGRQAKMNCEGAYGAQERAWSLVSLLSLDRRHRKSIQHDARVLPARPPSQQAHTARGRGTALSGTTWK